MSLVKIPGGILLPHYWGRHGGGVSLGGTSMTLDATGERAAQIFTVPRTGNITKIVWRTATVTTSQSLDIALETVSATDGFPTGTNYGGSTPGAQASVISNTMYETTLGTAAAATVGDVVAVVHDFTSTVGNLNIARYGAIRDLNQGMPYVALYTTSWAKQTDANGGPAIGIGYDDGTYEWVGGFVGNSISENSFNSGSTPDERGQLHITATPMRCAGFWANLLPANASATADMILYDASSNVLASASIDPDKLHGSGTWKYCFMRWAPVVMPPGTYRLALKPTSVNDYTYHHISMSSNAQLDCNHVGRNCYRTQRTDGGAWTDVDTDFIANMGLFIDQIAGPAPNPRLRRVA